MGTAQQWLSPHTFHHRQFADAAVLLERKQAQALRLSLCIPTLNEEATIAHVVEELLPLRDRTGLLDEIAVMDSGSGDRTRAIAASAGADVYLASEILPEMGPAVGKGENLWKALFQLKGDILIFIDGDIAAFHPGFVTGLIGPLLSDPAIGYVKGCYARPVKGLCQRVLEEPEEGGRLTEILVRPLLSLWYPNLTGFIQPLAGEYAARRALLEQLFFPVGYGVELAHLLDLATAYDVDIFAQTDLGERCHRHRSNRQLGQSAYGLLQVLFRRLHQQGKVEWNPENIPPLLQFVRNQGHSLAQELPLPELERPPLIQLASYRRRHHGRKTDDVVSNRRVQVED
ncbi:MAG: glucosyl-3-phosphoglycerate synthase [Desulfobulbus sp.]|nr:glucosyl-3-phosphoglycerate synthase [Desulfobulbus sp.]